jgi:hypothetical protein
VLVVVAGPRDHGARELAARLDVLAGPARVLCAADLAVAGWSGRIKGRAGAAAQGREMAAVVAGEPVDPDQIDGLVVRTPCVVEQDLPFIAADDRGYVAAEMTAFLAWWLWRLPCPVLNPPTPACLCGPGWSASQWVQRAAAMGMPVRTMRRRARFGRSELHHLVDSPVTVTVVGRRCLGDPDPALAERALQLAAAGGAGLLAVQFDGPNRDARVVGAHVWVDLSSAEATAAIAAALSPPARRRRAG